jgi:hypothetical protein
MSLTLIGAGFGRTGTLSLKLALERLGVGPCYHMAEVAKPENADHVTRWLSAARGIETDWSGLFRDYNSMVDWPGSRYWQELHGLWPDAKVLLSKRDSGRWYDSVMRTIYPASRSLSKADDPRVREMGEMIDATVWNGTFEGRIEDRQHAIRVFEAHNAEVERVVPSEKLLVYEPGEGWARLCAFLDCSVPDDAFPHVNSSEDFPKDIGSKS